ncbi:hypothetical protein BPUTSESOX_469 [uncultured Gammaproteobacteria bacterium]|jgi:hypothetical protein|uniref:macro domain-containing protein n=1 Tax=thiotrophic endosymbiont of Bathymodiolus puteoserpentis (Logatchev) TaxID=343240 RepID=UPI0010B656D3|nr:macro domain-containing protein [thiotrophic endosymbiont of Bathymodiolus puteoserpentis (Logatchev)]CAC9495590.1 hypothetical protein [uncultured Gammaproteobacteria bacterium]CAC9653178.1 hypothetical protein [uncultured Gammaproteobacteria bacterium]SSC10281.1 hypothetical protein BPUTEOSOX_53 [thiotrophic endosymbiont of Bathymodiolus puteoserpentis (Logatchev)]VVH50998.1 hypothetical protein BPUTSESOX_469 [uncultured Gammaproteobacteria bacterium]
MYSLKRWLRSYKSIIADFVTGIGLFWLFVEMASYSTDAKIDTITKSIWLFVIVSIVILAIALIKNKPKTVFLYQLRDKDNFIEVRVGDAFKNKGSLVIPFNNCFDVSLGGNVKKAKSLQNKLITEFYSGKEEHLATDISKKIDSTRSQYEIGTTIEIEQNEKLFYLLVNSRKENNRVESSVDDFLLSLSKLWIYIALESGRNSVVTIPLISTNHGRITNINRATAIKEIIESYIDASKSLNVSDKLIISIHPNDLIKGNINLDDIDDFLKFSCQHYKITTFSDKPEGTAESASIVKNISR